MGKILFWAAVIVGVLFITRLLAHQAARRAGKQEQSKPHKPASLSKAEEMVSCSHCGVYMPRSDAILQSEKFWCSTDHAKADVKHQSRPHDD